MRNYAYPAQGSHALSSVTTTGPAGSSTDAYRYDASGNTIARDLATGAQQLTWDAVGKLTKVTEGEKTTEFVYDADGNRLIRRDPAGSTLYLGGLELRLDKTTGQLTGTRYYQHGGKTVAMRTATGVTWLAGDHQGTAQIAVNSDTQQVVKRRQMPFGAQRGDAVTFPGEKGFVGGTIDASTGLTHLGTRDYEPLIGWFISVDPVMDLSDPQQMHGYTYGGNNPVANADPTGLFYPSCSHGVCIPGRPMVSPEPKAHSYPRASYPRCSGDACAPGRTVEPPGPVAPCKAAPSSTYCRIASFMVGEMFTNSTSRAARSMRERVARTCRVVDHGVCIKGSHRSLIPLVLFALIVCPDCPWDQKPVLRKMFGGDLHDKDSLMTDIPGSDLRINYDIWSNIHYGYVGMDIGFSPGVLMAGQRLPFAGNTDRSDEIAVQIGIDLRNRYRPERLTVEVITAAIWDHIPAFLATGDRKVLLQK